LYVILNAAMSIDGKITTRKNDSSISSNIDWVRVHKLRSTVDGIVIGISTVLKDDPMLNVRYAKMVKNPARIMRSSKKIQTFVAVTHDASLKKIKEIEKKGAKVLVIGREKVNIINLFQHLENLGLKKVLVEGGGEINWSILKSGLVNELIVTIAPIVIGGRDAKTLVEGEGISYIHNAIRMKLVKSIIQDNKEIVLIYRLR